MSPVERTLQYSSNVLVGGTGVLYGAMRYFMEPADEWAVVNHPWQPHLQHLHVVLAPLLVFACGLIWRRHVVNHWKHESHLRRSGPALAAMLIPMIASGYMLQVAVSPGWRRAWVVVHVASSCVWMLAFVVHFVGALLRRRQHGHARPGHVAATSDGPRHFVPRVARRIRALRRGRAAAQI